MLTLKVNLSRLISPRKLGLCFQKDFCLLLFKDVVRNSLINSFYLSVISRTIVQILLTLLPLFFRLDGIQKYSHTLVLEFLPTWTIWFLTKLFTEKMSQFSIKISVFDSPFMMIPVGSVTCLSGNKEENVHVWVSLPAKSPVVKIFGNCAVNISCIFLFCYCFLLLNTHNKSP